MSNAKFAARIRTWSDARQFHSGRPRRLGYETWLMQAGDDYQIVHFTTPILTFHRDGSCTINGAVVSKTTTTRLHFFRPEMVDRFNFRGPRGERPHFHVTLSAHPGEFDIEEGEKYRVFPDRTVVRV